MTMINVVMRWEKEQELLKESDMSKLSDKIKMEKREIKSSYDKTKMASDIIACFGLHNAGKLFARMLAGTEAD